jgi:PAS domain S-box-containing protein
MPDKGSPPVTHKSKIKRRYKASEVEEIVRALLGGMVDAFVIETTMGARVYSLHPFDELNEQNEILDAIRTNRADAVMVKTPSGDRVFALEGADGPYRVLLETMREGAAALDADGTVLYTNSRLAEILGLPPEQIVGASFYAHFAAPAEEKLRSLVAEALQATAKGEVSFRDPQGRNCLLRLALGPLAIENESKLSGMCCMVVSDVTELFEANESLRQSEEVLQQLSVRLLQSQDEERRRISRELHDSAGQYLSAAQMSLSLLEQSLSGSPPLEHLRPYVTEALQAVSECSKEIRTVSYLLHPPTLDSAGLTSAIEWLTDGFSKRSGIAVDLDITPALNRLPRGLETAIYRIVQESLTNIHRHSGSKWAGIRLLQRGNEIDLEVADRGRGMAEGATKTKAGVGISGIRERVRHLRGRLTIESSPQGTTLRATLPLTQEGDAEAAGQ